MVGQVQISVLSHQRELEMETSEVMPRHEKYFTLLPAPFESSVDAALQSRYHIGTRARSLENQYTAQ